MRFIIGVLITLGLIILVLVMLFHGGGKSTLPKTLILSDYAHNDSVAKLIIDGPITSQQTHQELEIDVSSSNVNFTLYSGYQRNVVKSQSYDNNDDAYTDFLKSLQVEGFTKGSTSPALKDERGVCPLGQRDIFSFTNDQNQLMRFWSTSCGGGSFKGKTATIISLFQKQVPNYSDLLDNTNFNGAF